MISLSYWLAFVTAASLIAVLPGPGIANIVGYALNSGRGTAFAAIAGAVAGNLIAMTVSLGGAGALLETFPLGYKSLELAGAVYLLSLGLVAVLRSQEPATANRVVRAAISPGAAFAGSVGVSALNPKSIIFFVAFVPQFISPEASYLLQSFVLAITFASVVAISDTLYALLAFRVAALVSSPEMALWIRRAGGVVLITTGLIAANAGWAGQ